MSAFQGATSVRSVPVFSRSRGRRAQFALPRGIQRAVDLDEGPSARWILVDEAGGKAAAGARRPG